MNNKKELLGGVLTTYYNDDVVNLKNAYKSIINQKKKIDNLIIVVDGPVTEELDIFLEGIKEESVKIIRISKNIGPAAARNIAINELIHSCEFIFIFDSDDISDLNRVRYQYKFAKFYKIDVVGSAYIEFKDGKYEATRMFPSNNFTIKLILPFLCVIANPTVMIRSKVLEKYKYEENFRVGEDYSLWLKLINTKFKIYNIKKCLIRYRVNDNFSTKRTGLDYAISDLINKISAINYKNFILAPAILIIALLSFSLRILPGDLFIILRNIRHKII